MISGKSIFACSLAFATLLLCPAQIWAASGTPFATRGTAQCPRLTGQNPPSEEQAAQLVACDAERVISDSYIVLEEDIQISNFEGPRDYNYSDDGALNEIDPVQPVYDISGSYVEYRCDQVSQAGAGRAAGENCLMGNRPQARGQCFKQFSGRWACHLNDFGNSGSFEQSFVAGPQ